MPQTNPPTDPNAAPTADPPADPSFWDTYGKPIASAGGLAAGMYFGKRAQDAAAQRSPEELAALNAVQGPNGSPATAASLMQESRPYITKPASYYQTLLNGNRAAMAQVTAPQRAALNESYKGTASQLATSGIRGAARDQIAGNIARQKASQVAGLTTGVQPAAAAALAGLGTNLQQAAVPLYNSSNNFYSQLLAQGLANRTFAAGQGQQTGASIGKLAADLGTLNFGKGKTPAKPAANAGGFQPGGVATSGPDYGPPEPPPQSRVLTGPQGSFTTPTPVDLGEGNYGDPSQFGWPAGTPSGYDE